MSTDYVTSDDDMVALFRAGSCLLVLLPRFEFQIYLHQMWVQYFVGYSGTPLQRSVPVPKKMFVIAGSLL